MTGRACRHERRQVYLAASRRQAVFPDKYDITKHPNYKYLSDADPKNAFDIEKYLSTRLKLKPEEAYEVFDTDETL